MARARAAGEMLHVAEPFLEQAFHPTVLCRGKQLNLQVLDSDWLKKTLLTSRQEMMYLLYVRHHDLTVFVIELCQICPLLLAAAYKMALEDALALLEKCSFAIDITNRKLDAVAGLV